MNDSPNTNQKKIITWLKRYGPAELCGIMTAYLGFFITKAILNHPVATAYGAALGETIGYYIVIIISEICHIQKAKPDKHIFHRILYVIAHVITEFGPAEILDSLLLRPLFMGIAIYFFGDLLGILIGKLAADITFYVPVIVSYELRQRYYRNKKR